MVLDYSGGYHLNALRREFRRSDFAEIEIREMQAPVGTILSSALFLLHFSSSASITEFWDGNPWSVLFKLEGSEWFYVSKEQVEGTISEIVNEAMNVVPAQVEVTVRVWNLAIEKEELGELQVKINSMRAANGWWSRKPSTGRLHQ